MFSDMMYEKKDKVLKEFNEHLNNISQKIISTNDYMFSFFDSFIEKEFDIINMNYIVSDYMNTTFSDIMSSMCYKNIISLLSAIDLVKQGYLGSATIIFRNVYENLLIGKLIGVTNDYSYYERWVSGEQFSIRVDVFARLVNTPSDEAKEFWDILNKYVHSTIYAQDFELELNEKKIQNCNSIISALLDMNYHLLNTFVSKYHNYYLKYYFGDYYDEIKKELRIILSESRKMLDKRLKKVIKEYTAKWVLK